MNKAADLDGHFRGRIQDLFVIGRPQQLCVMSVTEIKGVPKVGMTVTMADRAHQILEVSGISGFGGPASTRSGLTGKPILPTSAMVIDWTGSQEESYTLREADVVEASP